MTFRRLACLLVTTAVPLAGASHDERLDRLESQVAELRSLFREVSGKSSPEVTRRTGDRQSTGEIYRVRSGDSYWSISRKLGIPVKALERANPGTDASRLRIGAALRLPDEDFASGPNAPSPVKNPTDFQSAPGGYAIKKGDILGRISEAHGIRLHQLLAANPGLNPKRLKIGQILNIPGQSAPRSEKSRPVPDLADEFEEEIPDLPGPPAFAGPPAPPSPDPAATATATTLVTVDENVRFAEIASRHRTSVAVLNRLNEIDLSPEQMIKTGSQLYVPGQ